MLALVLRKTRLGLQVEEKLHRVWDYFRSPSQEDVAGANGER